ncbi:MAG: reverse transcriptase domain-containing protein [Propionibacteriaceae bacterium]|nr:reverse transcriptase domain-containing protein [Propionibacteriaceae bacterium]
MSIIDQLDDPGRWREFQAAKLEKSHLTTREKAELESFIETASYADVVAQIRTGQGFEVPTRKLVNKLGSRKKRVVYSFDSGETWVLKLISYLLYAWDDRQPQGCYSFRRGFGAHRAMRMLTGYPGMDQMWCYKVDVRDYFNSIDIPTLLPILGDVIDEDPPLLEFLSRLLTSDLAQTESGRVCGPRGVMAGIPIAPFLANLYLGGVDRHFTAQARPYARYSDDIIVFASTQTEIEQCKSELGELLTGLYLEVNSDKEFLYAPGEAWEFLGFSYCQGQIDLSQATKMKLKSKVRRKSRALRRWMLRKDAAPARAMKAMIRSFNRKFFETGRTSSDLTWSRWFFPLLSVDSGLAQMDAYLQQEIRYIPTGRHSRSNYRVKYSDLKALGYRSLVHEFWRFHEAKKTQEGETWS